MLTRQRRADQRREEAAPSYIILGKHRVDISDSDTSTFAEPKPLTMSLVEASEELKKQYLESIPHATVWEGQILPGGVTTPDKMKAMQDMVFDENDVIIVSYPKSGTTWVSEVLSAIAYEGNTEKLKQVRMDERVPWIEMDHRCWDPNSPVQASAKGPVRDGKKQIWFSHLHLDYLPPTARAGKCKVVYVARNPKDNAVSYFHFHRLTTFMGLQKDMKWNDYFPLFCSGYICVGNWFKHTLDYWKFTRNNPNAKFVVYEDLKKDLMGEMQSLEEFVGIPLTPEQRLEVVKHCSFDSMKDNKMTNREGLAVFDHGETKFMRKGIVGDWKNYFTVAQNEAFDELYKSKFEGTGLSFEFE
ncbi:hypothetical protein PRIPAC_79000 [Pristionchus pacificus]|uniref:Sulfotransfer_1 domain-containing protein n=1 Tax=Pristionchus pacificus TaxID=54126 RepID=A0A2A6CN11_PRIPA|nr:hypothetical protein PRIPAC_79000 [Pristionchus pacificus]|eukprot:PDM79625.1 hypothetical protein PRIPAC_32204 [Pristionchus pacificus]